MLLLLLIACGPPVYTCTDPLPAHEPDTSNLRLHQEGTRLIGVDGAEIKLDSVNLGGWLLWESWIWGRPLDLLHLDRQSESHMLARLTELYGSDEAAKFRTRLDEDLITDADLAAIAALGFSTVRLPLNHTVVEDPARLAIVDALLDSAAVEGIQVVLDLHAAPGGQADLFTADPDATLLWDDPEAQAATVELWGVLAARYAGNPAVVGYDLLNEPLPPDEAVYLALLRDIIAAVRAQDPDTLLIVEGTAFSRDFRPFTERLDENMAYEAHLYTSMDGRAIDRVAGFAELQTCHDIPVWLGEFGEDQPEDVAALWEAADVAGLAGTAFWPWKKVPTGNPGLGEIEPPEDWLTLLDDLTAAEGKPGHLERAVAESALQGFLEAAAPDVMTVNAEMAGALHK